MSKPIIAYSIEAALDTKLFDEVMVSTDDEEIAAIARQYGAQVPFIRSIDTANDYATLADVINEVIGTYNSRDIEFDNVCCILATAPLVTSNQLCSAYNKLIGSEDLTTVYPIVPFSYPVLRCVEMDQNGYINMKWPEYAKTRSQDLEVMYHDSGTFYWHKIKPWLSGTLKKGGIVVDEMSVQDIDTENDWKLAELKYSLMNKDGK